MIFHQLEFLWALAILPLLALLYMAQTRLKARRAKRHLGPRAPFLSLSVSPAKRHIKMGLRMGVLALLIVALSRPQTLGEKQEIPRQGIYLLLLIDTSLSMLAEDIKPSRLEFMKKEISRLADMSLEDQIALVFFAESPSLVLPFTNDVSAVRSYLNDLFFDQIAHQGTNFEEAFRLGIKVFDRIQSPQKEQAAKAIVLASDGEDHGALRRKGVKDSLLEKDIRVFSLSFGTKQGDVIPIKDQNGRLKEYKKDQKGDLVLTRLQAKALKQFARWGRGAYYHADYGGQAIESLRQDLNLLQKSQLAKTAYAKKEEHYQWFLLMALLLALLDGFLTDRVYARSFFL